MLLALLARKFADDWVNLKMDAANWQKSGGIPACAPTKDQFFSPLCGVKVVVLFAHSVAK